MKGRRGDELKKKKKEKVPRVLSQTDLASDPHTACIQLTGEEAVVSRPHM